MPHDLYVGTINRRNIAAQGYLPQVEVTVAGAVVLVVVLVRTVE